MNQLEQETKFLSVHDGLPDKTAVTIAPLGRTSVKLILPCGCYQAQHLIDSHRGERSDIHDANRRLFHEFCKQHN